MKAELLEEIEERGRVNMSLVDPEERPAMQELLDSGRIEVRCEKSVLFLVIPKGSQSRSYDLF